MKRFVSYPIILGLIGLTSFQVHAQLNVLNEAVQKIGTYKNISYSQIEKQKSPFSDDITILSTKSLVAQVYQNGKTIVSYIQDDNRGYKTISNDGNKIDLNLNSKTFSISKGIQDYPSNSPNFLLGMLKQKLLKAPKKIKQLPDTTINHAVCYHFKLPFADSIQNHEIYDLCLDKTNYLPVYVKQFLQGKFGKGDATSDVIAIMITEDTFSDYHYNSKHFPDITAIKVPSDFKPEEKLTLLSPGEKVPDWKLQDLKGNSFSSNELRGKVILIDFSFNACAACAVSLPMLNRLHQKYNDSEVKVISINVFDSKESVMGYIRKNNINYPILLKGNTVTKIFKVSSYPTFYLIDKQGIVITVFNGYSNELEKSLVNQIDKLM